MTEDPRILIIAGPNGAGKTTFAIEYLPGQANNPPFLNADRIATGLSPIQGPPRHFAAGRKLLEEMERRVRQGSSFAFETTLAGRGVLRRIRRWRSRGYRLTLFYLRLASVELAIERVRQRVAEGGHDVPEAVIRRRFLRSWRNFEHLARPIVDSWALYDNSGPRPLLVSEGPGAERGSG